LDYLCHHPDHHLAGINDVRTGVTLMELAGVLGEALTDNPGTLGVLNRLDSHDRQDL